MDTESECLQALFICILSQSLHMVLVVTKGKMEGHKNMFWEVYEKFYIIQVRLAFLVE